VIIRQDEPENRSPFIVASWLDIASPAGTDALDFSFAMEGMFPWNTIEIG
jgi:hypothetical protein